MSGCTSWLGHKFEARYDNEPGGDIKCGPLVGQRLVDVIKATNRQTYIHDICVRCGEIKRRPNTREK